MSNPTPNDCNFRVTIYQDGIVRNYYCENHFDTVVLFDALSRISSIESLEAIALRTNWIVQSLKR